MATSSAASNALRPLRLPRIIDVLRSQPLPAEVMLPQLNKALRTAGIPEISLRTLQHDLEWLLANLGKAGIERVARADLNPPPPTEFHRYRIFYRLIGAEDLISINSELVFLCEMEALALVAARAQLATPATPGVKDVTAGPLADALDNLIRRLGLGAKDNRIPDILAVTQAAPEPYDPAHLLAVLRAIRLRDAVEMQYHSLGKPVKTVIAQPIRVALVEGEPYLWAWDSEAKKLKNYKVARVESVIRCHGLPGVPSGLDAEVRGNLSAGFRGVAGAGQRGRVVLRLTATAVPHLRHRKLGGSLDWKDLPDGGARVAFNTSGMEAIRHWLLQCGGEIVVESPAPLVAWFAAETERMAAAYRQPAAKSCTTAVTAND
jgi:predicted DNA-binding transcriptional regulator YafY